MVFFIPKTVETRTSEINGKIKVVKVYGKLSINAGGFTQSGGLIHIIWEKVLRRIEAQQKFIAPDILILGLGAGSAAGIATGLWPESQITGIEIDPLMIELGNKYLNLSSIPNLNLVNEDAMAWVAEKANETQRFDLILVDLYIGGNPPRQSLAKPFLKGVSHLLKKDSLAVFNRLIRKGNKAELKEFKEKLDHVFGKIERVPTPANAVFTAYKS